MTNEPLANEAATSSQKTEAFAKKLDGIREDASLSRQAVAQIVGISPRTVIRWATGQSTPRGVARERLLELAVVSQYAAKVMSRDAVNIWLYEPNALLEFKKPVELIAEGDYRKVVGAIRAIGEGVFV